MSPTTNLMLQWVGVGIICLAAAGWIVWKRTRPRCARTSGACNCNSGKSTLPMCEGCALAEGCRAKRNKKIIK